MKFTCNEHAFSYNLHKGMECSSYGRAACMIHAVLWKAFSVPLFSMSKSAGHACYLESDCLDSNTGSATC